jgi:hypothetical protein
MPVIATLKTGSVLGLEVTVTSVKVVVAKTAAGKIAGTITTQTQKLIECIEDGHNFEAEVKEVKGAHCSVLVRPK